MNNLNLDWDNLGFEYRQTAKDMYQTLKMVHGMKEV